MSKVKEFSDIVFEFVVENNIVRTMKQVDPSGGYRFEQK